MCPFTLNQKKDILQKRPTTPTLKVYTISYLKNHTRSFDYTLEVMRTLENQTREEIHRLGGNERLETFMDLLHVKCTSPNHSSSVQ
jgi:geranylgeranyl diphosphate synthase, type III